MKVDIPADGEYCVYVHRWYDEVFYVGKGRPHRPFSRASRNKLWWERTKGRMYTVEIVKWFKTDEAACVYERELIFELRPSCNIVYGWGFDEMKEDTPMTRDVDLPEVQASGVDGKQFNAGAFLAANFEGAADLVRMVSAYGLGDIPYGTAQKWFQRGRISAIWFPHLLCALEFEHCRAVAVREFFA